MNRPTECAWCGAEIEEGGIRHKGLVFCGAECRDDWDADEADEEDLDLDEIDADFLDDEFEDDEDDDIEDEDDDY